MHSDFLSSCVLAAEKMYTKRKEVMFLGDFNIDMLTENESSVGSSYSLSNFCDQFCLTNTISVHTRVTASTKTLLDVILVSHPERFVSSGTLRLGISDLDLIYIVRKQRLPKPNMRSQLFFRPYVISHGTLLTPSMMLMIFGATGKAFSSKLLIIMLHPNA